MKKDRNSQHYRKSSRQAIPDALAGSIQQLIIEKVVPGGMGLCRWEGQVVFVAGSLPGEEVRIELGQAQGGFRNARIVEIVQASPQRLAPPCPHYGICGGCDFQYADPAYQLELKQSILTDTLRRQGGVDLVGENLAVAGFTGQPWSYRNRMQFHPVATSSESKAKLGLMARDSTLVVPLSNCPVAAPEIQGWLAGFPAFVASPDQDGLEEIEGDANNSAKTGRMKVFGVEGRLIIGQFPTELMISGRTLRFSTGGFFQSNVAMLQKLLDWLGSRLPGGALAWDLYCGCGVFASLLQERFSQVKAVDNVAINVDFARNNTSPDRTEVFHAGVDDWLSSQLGPAPDLVVVDPPRAGLSRHLMQWLIQAQPGFIAYISCNPVTFSRDLKILRVNGYRIREMALFDFYPQTWHLETACLFELDGA